MDLDENMNVIDNLVLNITAPNAEVCQMLEGSLYSFARNTLVEVLDKILAEENISENLELDELTVDVDEVDSENALTQFAEKLPEALKTALSKAVFKKNCAKTLSILSDTYHRVLPMEETFNLEKNFENYVDDWYRQHPDSKFNALSISEYIIKIMMQVHPHLDVRQIAYTVYQKIKQMEASTNKKAKNQISQNDVSDSGIVLLSPYVPMLLNRIGLVNGNVFASEDARLKAVAVLCYAVFGGYKIPQNYSLVINVICGYERDFKAKNLPELTSDEKSLVDGLLVAVVKNWGAIGNTSAEGLRTSFLIRKGKLEDAENGLNIQVEKNSFDMLLDKLPWGYSMVKFPWMKDRLNVKWR